VANGLKIIHIPAYMLSRLAEVLAD